MDVNNGERCADCPYDEKISKVYEAVVTGNGRGPLQGRVITLEGKMSSVEDVLTSLHDMAIEQRGVEKAKVVAESAKETAQKSRDRKMQLIGLIIAALMFVIAVLQLWPHKNVGELKNPFHSSTAPVLAHNQQPQLSQR